MIHLHLRLRHKQQYLRLLFFQIHLRLQQKQPKHLQTLLQQASSMFRWM
jgi:hypothetical protein